MPAKTALKVTTRLASNLTTCRFESDLSYGDAGWWFGDAKEAAASPLAARLFGLETVVGVKLQGKTLSVTRDTYEDWPETTRKVADILAEHAASGTPAVKPGTPSNLPTPEAIKAKVEEILETQVNPAVAAHGGEISLVDVKGSTVLVRLMGGCHGCASATVTLRQGVERALRDAVPQIDDVVDVTDHAGGTNPYYQGH